MSFEVRKAKRQRRPLKVNFEGVSGSGKTYSALRLAFAMRRVGIGRKIVVADSENDSAGLYDGICIDGERWEYDVCPLPPEKQNPVGYKEAYEYLVGQGFDIIIGDSLTHAWHGAQEMVDKIGAANRGDKFGSGWKTVTPHQRAMLAALTDNRAHFIGTMRLKSEYAIEEKDNGKKSIKKIGTKTDQREGAEYEFDCVVRMDRGELPTDHIITVEKVRGCTAMDGRTGVNPGPDFWKPLFDWWLSAEPVAPKLLADLKEADTLPGLQLAFEAFYKAWKSGQMTDAEYRDGEKVKNDKKAQLAPSAPQQQKPTPATDVERDEHGVPLFDNIAPAKLPD